MFLQPLRSQRISLAMMMIASTSALADWQFTDVSEQANAAWVHSYPGSFSYSNESMTGGVAAADYDRDGDIDLYLETGEPHPNVLLRNDGKGKFDDVAIAAGVGLEGHLGVGPAFADMNHDGWPDLVVGGVLGAGYVVFLNNRNGTFSEATQASGIEQQSENQYDFSSGFGDPDGDGDLDLFVSHWGADKNINHLWLNRGDGRYFAADEWAGIDVWKEEDWSFSPIFSDIDADGFQDLLVSSDFETSQVMISNGEARFTNVTTPVIDEENGMGTAVFDYDNDGDMDWFVTSVFRPVSLTKSGNRLYQNDGEGNLSNVTEESNLRYGLWGWAACAADFNNDGWQDIFHVNGFNFPGGVDYTADASRLFINMKDGSFDEISLDVGILDERQGRGVSCFDYDNDGDIDIFTANYHDESTLFRNDLEDNPGWIQIRLEGEVTNPSAVGAKIRLTEDGVTQTREITVASNYVSQNPMLQHFGLGGDDPVEEIRVDWPGGGETVLKNTPANQRLTIRAADAVPAPLTIGAGHSAAWFDPSHNGEGFLLEVLASGHAVLYWFTYDGQGRQDWYIAVGRVEGRRALFPELLRVSGGRFGPEFDPDKIERKVVGSAAFTWQTCKEGFMDWFLDDPSLSENIGRQNLIRLTTLPGVDCDAQTASAAEDYAKLSGSWYDPSHDGEGFVIETLADNQVLVYWFSYAPQGQRRWFFSVGRIENSKLIMDEMLTTSGGIFGESFDPDTIELPVWGSLEMNLSCAGGTASYNSTEPGFGSGNFQLVKLTQLKGLDCPAQ